MQETRYDGSEQWTDLEEHEVGGALRKALANKRNASVAIHKPDSPVMKKRRREKRKAQKAARRRNRT